MARADKLRKRQGPPRPCRFGCRGARRSEWGYLLRETRATDGTFGVVEQTIPPSCTYGGEAAGDNSPVWLYNNLTVVGGT